MTGSQGKSFLEEAEFDDEEHAHPEEGDAAGDEDFKMEAVAINDERIASLKKELKDATFIYVKEITLSAEDAGWTMTYKIDGVEHTYNGNLAVKVIKTDATDTENIPVWWAQSPESGRVNNLTPETLYVSPFDNANDDGEGDWNANPCALAAGTYYMVFAKVNGVLQLGLIAK